jgi:hypothetical protein
MTESATTPFANQVSILAELWLNYRQDEDFIDFIEYNDLGLPLAYAIANDIVDTSPKATAFIGETFDLLITALDVEDNGFDNLDELLGLSAITEEE